MGQLGAGQAAVGAMHDVAPPCYAVAGDLMHFPKTAYG